jgi:hypothetical protein
MSHYGFRQKKTRVATGFSADLHQCGLGMDGIHGTGIHASTTVNAGIGVDYTLGTLLADGAHRARVLTCGAISTVVGNGMSHGFTSL